MAARKAAKPTTGHPFQLGGRSFNASKVLPMGAYLVFIRKTTNAQMGVLLMACDDLVRAWLPPEQHAAWDEALNATTDLADLLTVANELIEVATNRPTRAPAS